MRALVLALAVLATPAWAQHGEHAAEPAAEEEAIGSDPAPSVPTDHAADRFNSVQAMAAARAELRNEGRFRTASVKIERLEYRSVDGADGYGWEGSAWVGGDIDRLVIASEGEGVVGHGPERAEVAALWRHALDPWFNLEAGVRHDFRPDPERTYAVVGIEGLAPYWIEVEAQLLASNKGDLHARLEASIDQRLTNRLIVRPSIELDVAFQSVPELRIGAGAEKIELGARLRYEIVPEFAPYVGVHWEQRLGQSADYARADGERPSAVSAVLGVRAWF